LSPLYFILHILVVVEYYNYKVKIKFTPEQAMKAQRGSRRIALFFL
jgi:hypothetical protein